MRNQPSRHLHLAACLLAIGLTTLPAWAGTLKVLHNFTNGKDGNVPEAGVVMDLDGNLYGATILGGVAKQGVVFKLTPTTAGPWKETILAHFTGGKSGSNPYAVAVDTAGTVFGITQAGGVPTRGTKKCMQEGCGIVFELVPTTTGESRVRTIHTFTGGPDGAFPNGITIDVGGNIYVTTLTSAANCGAANCGTVFKLTP